MNVPYHLLDVVSQHPFDEKRAFDLDWKIHMISVCRKPKCPQLNFLFIFKSYTLIYSDAWRMFDERFIYLTVLMISLHKVVCVCSVGPLCLNLRYSAWSYFYSILECSLFNTILLLYYFVFSHILFVGDQCLIQTSGLITAMLYLNGRLQYQSHLYFLKFI